jgi:hypothetical protein
MDAKILSSILKNAVGYYNAGVVVVKSEVARSAPEVNRSLSVLQIILNSNFYF